MRLNRKNPYPEKALGFWLTLSVHSDAFCADPRAYLTALWWRLRRKRLRSRGQFAELFKHSRRIYDLWILREQGVEMVAGDEFVEPVILALVDASAAQEALTQTLQNLSAEEVPALVFGTGGLPTLIEAARKIDWCSNPWLMPLSAGDRIAPGTAKAYRARMSQSKSTIIYADDDLLNKVGRRTAPHFKPDWNSELFQHFDYLSGACIFRTSFEEMEQASQADEWVKNLVARRVEEGKPFHLRQMLHHRRARPLPKVPAMLERMSRNPPPVTIIVPTRNRVDLLATCLSGIASTDYPHVEVIVVDNDSDDPETLSFLNRLDPRSHRVLRHKGIFNYSAINNRAAGEARGQLLCLLNNDIEVIEPKWLTTMATQAIRDDVGAVGARLLYPDGRIQHAGVVIGMGNAAGHCHRFLDPDEEGYFRRHALPQFTSAVTAACLVVQRDRFFAVGGLDERNFPVAFNDVDLCMRLNQRGWQSLYEPRATLIHHESVSRGFDRDPVGAARFAGELAALKRLWKTDEVVDPFHHPELSRASESFLLRL
ncbi:glycosyltransferase family 2 protein [Sphingobium estronivorans]|uniref:glycosyltransferase family 2 protein n=1 Tax=Sphingobium estronivorans TaxID=1577690 RepID=UPI00123A0A20|nr:glycosyltransferase family 2 protein [Sphingobium estronivorans]